MCGIAGYWGNNELPKERIEACLQQMRRRGPDAAAFNRYPAGDKQVYLLHSRLSIIDLDERANQPFETGQHVLAYNGELYNYLELKQELESRGEAFRTGSDTEVLMRILQRDGWPGLDRCEGMWALACFNQESGTLLLARDRFGEKPLYLYQDATGLYFGSEVKFIVTLLGRPLAINHNHLYRYLVNGYKALYKTTETFFTGLAELPAATVLELGQGSETRHIYWLPHYQADESLTYSQIVEKTRAALLDAVKLRLRADVPLAFCMSGGVDSNTLISIAKGIYDYDVHGFTIVNTDQRYEESELVAYAIQEQKLRHTPIPLNTEKFLPRLRQLVKHHDAPVYTLTYYTHWLLMESISEHGYRISISGTGADELFTGYYDHHLAYLYEVRDEAGFPAALQAWEQQVKPLVRNPYLSNPYLFIKNPQMRDHIFLNADDFAAYLHQPWVEPFAERHYTDSLLRNRMLNEMFVETVPPILHEDDLNAMYFSVENRSPFLDRRLFEHCFHIPSRYLIRKGFGKSVLRDAMRGIVPERILDEPRKVGFNAPIFSLLDIRDPAVQQELLNDSPIFEHVKRDRIEQLLVKPDLPNSESKFLFYFLNSKIFLEEFAS